MSFSNLQSEARRNCLQVLMKQEFPWIESVYLLEWRRVTYEYLECVNSFENSAREIGSFA